MPPPAASRRIQPLVIRRRHSPEEEAPEGVGTWKIAYADFVTAMMAFFMLLWLVNITTPEQRDGIADYFNPITVSDSNSGADGQLAGRSVAKDGALTSNAASAYESIPTARVPTLSAVGPDQDALGARDADAADPRAAADRGPWQDPPQAWEPSDSAHPEPPDLALHQRLAAVKAEELVFDQVEESVRQALLSAIQLADLARNVSFDRTGEGLRIQITDRPHFSMFELGSAALHPRAEALMGVVAAALTPVPHRLAIAGHTDGRPFAADARYTNWELSTDRANAARRLLLSGGVPVARIARVEGLADTLHLFPGNAEDPRNRRISITLLRRVPLPGVE